MENTLENKAKFFALYWGQKVKRYNTKSPLIEIDFVDFIDITERDHIELKPLSSISGEDAIHVANLLWGNAYKATRDELIETGKYRVERERFGSYEGYFQDYFRSKGYAIQYLDLSIENQIEYGWVKLKEALSND